MFKKNPNRPPMVLSLKRVQGGYKVVPNEGHSLFQVKRIIRTMCRPDLVAQGTGMRMEQNGFSLPSTIIQPPSHFTFPAFASWFSLSDIHSIECEAFPQFFEQQYQSQPFSFGTRNAKLYKYYRNTMVGTWLQNVKKHLSAAHCRRILMGDVSLIVRIHGFLQNWGIINFPSREHSKGMQVKASQRLTCYICQESEEEVYYVVQVQDQILQLCQNCFQEGLYPSELEGSRFVRILQKNYEQPKHRIMTTPQLLRLMDCFTTHGGSREKERDMWSAAQKQFSQFTREQLVYNFLRIPKLSQMNANIFQNNEQVSSEDEPEQDPTVFEDFQNPLQSSIAVAYCNYKKSGCKQQGKLARIFQAAQQHSRKLGVVQEEKIQELTKMLVDVSFSKLQLKSIFIQEYQKLVEKCLKSQQSAVSNILAECLKQNTRFFQNMTQSQNLSPSH